MIYLIIPIVQSKHCTDRILQSFQRVLKFIRKENSSILDRSSWSDWTMNLQTRLVITIPFSLCKEYMTIPGTREIDTNSKVSLIEGNELFCFCIQQLNCETYLSNFISAINEYLPKYVFSLSTLTSHENKYQRGLTRTSPLERAREMLQKTKVGRAFDSGEFGEFLLYLFAKEVKGAYKLATKIHARGSDRATIPGRDNTFAWQSEDGDIYMLVGEAKTEPSSNNGLRNAQRDLNDFWVSGKLTHEISLASTHLRSEMRDENASIYEAYFIDDNERHSSLKYKNLIFVGYSSPAITDLRSKSIGDEEFCDRLCVDLQNSFTNQQALITESPYAGIYCFLPFESIDEARTTFADINNLVI